MNDRYLCKAKRLDNGKWVEGYLVLRKYEGTNEVCAAYIIQDIYEQVNVLNLGPTPALVSEVGETCFRVDPSTICRYTDKEVEIDEEDSRKIWENDVLHLRSRKKNHDMEN